MRRAPAPTERPPAVPVGLEEHLRATAERLASLPDEHASSVSVTIGWQGWLEADVRALARSAAAAVGAEATVHPDGDVVTVRFARTARHTEGAG